MRILTLLFFIAVLHSCTINKNIMFKTHLGYEYDIPADSSVDKEYRIFPNDRLNMRVFTNNGARLIEMTTFSGETAQRFLVNSDVAFLVRPDGFVEMPEIGDVLVQGLTLREAELRLEEMYAKLYSNPYVILNVINNRVMVFPGSGGDARVITLANNNTSVIEALALAGGIAMRGNAAKVKLIRPVTGTDPDVYLMDLSTIEGIQYANMPVQANDIIYVEPVPEIAGEVLRDLAPIVTLVTSIALIYGIVGGL